MTKTNAYVLAVGVTVSRGKFYRKGVRTRLRTAWIPDGASLLIGNRLVTITVKFRSGDAEAELAKAGR
jgi:hypothetical protein